MILAELRQEVLDTARSLPAYGLVWMAGGTACARDPETGYLVVTPSGMAYTDLTAEDMIITDMDLRVIEGKYRPSIALNLWANFFRSRTDIHGLVHTHSPHATAFSVVYESIPVVTETMADWFGAPVPVVPYLHVEDPKFDVLPAQIMGDGFGVLLGNHGPITVGKSLKHALERAVTLEEAARTYAVARTLGTPTVLTLEQAQASYEYYFNRYGQRAAQAG